MTLQRVAVQLLSVLLAIFLCNPTRCHVVALTVDVQLVSARNDCFERIALEAMLPFDKTFRTEDTNSLKSCKEKCIQAGERCQSMSFGVHRRGNGTCQLSSEKYVSMGTRPKGIIFDPDFDLYSRKTNCFDLSDNTIPQADSPTVVVDSGAPIGGGGGGGGGYGSSLSPTPEVLLSSRPDEGTPILTVDPTPSTLPTTIGRPSGPLGPTTGYDSATTNQLIPIAPSSNPTDGDRLYFSHEIYPLYKYPMLYEHNYPAPNSDFYIPGGYASNVPSIDIDRYHPSYPNNDENVRPTPQGPPRPIFGLGYGNGYSYGKPERYSPTTVRPYNQGDRDRDWNRDRDRDRDRDHDRNGVRDRDHPNYAPRPEQYPSASRPDRPIETTRPNNYDTTPSTYYTPPASEPSRPTDYNPNRGPTRTPSQSRPGNYNDFTNRPDPPGTTYGSGSSIRPPMRYPDQRPTQGNDGESSGRPPIRYPEQRPTQANDGESSGRPPLRYPEQRPTQGNDGDPSGRPPIRYPEQRPTQSYGGDPSMRPPIRGSADQRPATGYGSAAADGVRYGYVRRNDSVPTHTGGYGGYNDDKTISTYFNPEDYMPGGSKYRPGLYPNRDRFGYPFDEMKACFRRVLAGKRIAPQWVRRTIACERVEECMRECGYEKRFMCEGFNYRLDPSGHGQGDCELIDVPLARMDLYSSPNRRDSNLLRHPDYDYYERDRNAPSSCRKNLCEDCRLTSPPLYFKPSASGWGGSSGGGSGKPYSDEHYLPTGSGSSGYGSSGAGGDYRYPPSSHSYEHRRPPPPQDYHSGSYEFSSHGSSYFEHTPPSSYGSTGSGAGSSSGSGASDRYDSHHHYGSSGRPDRWESIPSSSGYDSSSKYRPRPEPDRFRPPYLPGPNYSPYRQHELSGPSGPSGSSYHAHAPPPPPSTHNYLDREEPPPSSYKKPSKFVPYLIGGENSWGSYGGSYGGSSYNKQSSYWGLNDQNRRKDPYDFNYFELGTSKRRGPSREPNSVLSYPGSKYGPEDYRDRHDYHQQWTRRPGPDECSAKTSEGFRLHKTAVRHSYSAPTLTECEKLCSGQDGFTCQTFSYRYSPVGRDNCMLCDRPVNHLDYYVDIEPDRDYDIYSMTDDLDACRKPSRSDGPPIHGDRGGDGSSTALIDPRNMQCFFRALDGTRFFKSIVRDSLTVRSVGECEMECIKSSKFTCRAFAFRYGKQRHASVIDNCQLSDWPVRDMDKDRHLIMDATFDVFERASYGHGCELQPIMDPKHKKFCYLGYGSPAKLLPTAIKKVISVATEVECKKECMRFRETTSFKCYSFSYGAHERSYNCEMSDLDQTELKINVHYTHTKDRDYWLFAWNPFDWTCRDKVNTIGGGTRINNDRRMDIFREPGELTWRHYTVSGKACRKTSSCDKNLVTGFYSCEIEGGEIGSWDYCCKTDHPCGYSNGFDYPWCFVGDEPDQWRKCSDRYYPSNRTQTHSGYESPTSKSDKKKHLQSSSASINSEEFQRPPRPGGLQSLSDFAAARLWPVTYLYSEGPPNSTEFSNFVDCNKESC